MAPTITATSSNSPEYLPLSHKLRKPLVEKLRRERINSSIEQLKSLLSPEFLKQQQDSKLEKADILEMTVCVLTRLQLHNVAAVTRSQSSCVQEVPHFLSSEEVKTQSTLMKNFNKLQNDHEFSPPTSTVDSNIKAQIDSAFWRPW